MAKEIGYSWNFTAPTGDDLQNIVDNLDDTQKRLYEKDNELFLKLNDIRKRTEISPQFSSKTKSTIGEDSNGKLNLAVRMQEFSPSFNFIIRDGKIEFSDRENLTPEKMKYLRAYLEFNGISDFSFPNDFDKEAKDAFVETGAQIQKAAADGDDQWFDNFFKELWAGRPENLPQQEETARAVRAPQPKGGKPVNLGSIYEDMSKFIGKQQGRTFGKYAERYTNWFPTETVFEVFKGDIRDSKSGKRNKPSLVFRIKEKKINGKKGLELNFSSPNNDKIDPAYYGEFLSMMGKYGAAPVDVSDCTDADKDEFRTQSAKKCVMITGAFINDQHLKKMFEAVRDSPKGFEERANYKLALVGEVDRLAAADPNGLGKDTAARRQNITISARLDLFESTYESAILAEIEGSRREEDAPKLIGACKAAKALFNGITEGKTISEVIESFKTDQRTWQKKMEDFDGDNPFKNGPAEVYAEFFKQLQKYQAQYGNRKIHDIPPEDLIKYFYEPLRDAEKVRAEADIIDNQLEAHESTKSHIQHETSLRAKKERAVVNAIRSASSELNSSLSQVNKGDFAQGYKIPGIEPFYYDAVKGIRGVEAPQREPETTTINQGQRNPVLPRGSNGNSI